MGSTTITYAAVALAVGLVCLLIGFLRGRSNVRAKVEQAVEEGLVSLDAREFAMRQQLDEAIGEIARLRPLAEELEQVQDRLKREQSKYQRMKADFDATLNGGVPQESTGQEIPPQTPEPPEVHESADEAIQRLLQSLENLNQPDTELDEDKIEPGIPEVFEHRTLSAPLPVADSSPIVQRQTAPRPQVNEIRPALELPAKPGKPEPQRHVPAEQNSPSQSGVDEWQEFARSLAALTGRKQ
ncbi:MAG TPA: hypothetical protein VGI45_10925 [Terracidiphilus sp.]|jgi:hypothetical protein